MRLVVTGNIGCGKSTVCEMLRETLPGYAHFSVDDAVRSLYSDSAYQAALQAEFGTSDRRALSDLVFAQPQRKQALEHLASRFIKPLVDKAFSAARVVIEFPLFFELPTYLEQADFVLALGCDDDTQEKRVCARDKMSLAKLARIRASQLSTGVKAALSDAYVDTSASLQEVRSALEQLMPRIRERELQARCDRFFGSRAVWPRIEQAYKQSHRAYHNLTHLHDLFAALDPYLAQAPHADAIELAVWFHDFVYATELSSYSQNESASAKALLEVLRKDAPHWLDKERSAEVFLATEFIMATKRHTVSSPFVLANVERTNACALFLDADLSILAADLSRFQRYDADIAREWGQDPQTPTRAFCEARANAMDAFSQRSEIYFSSAFKPLEALARRNLSEVVAQWRARITG